MDVGMVLTKIEGDIKLKHFFIYYLTVAFWIVNSHIKCQCNNYQKIRTMFLLYIISTFKYTQINIANLDIFLLFKIFLTIKFMMITCFINLMWHNCGW